jgi:GNAT superfamily N-acetyltransferase
MSRSNPSACPRKNNIRYVTASSDQYELQGGRQELIEKCNSRDAEAIFNVINESARAYKGVIPDDRYHEPYMSPKELQKEMSEMTFFGYRENRRLVGVAGYQRVMDMTLVRHVYVLPECQRKGIGEKLLHEIMRVATTQRILVGTWAAAVWAIRFYEKHGFELLRDKDQLLRKYWRIPERQIELSVVLGIEKPEK